MPQIDNENQSGKNLKKELLTAIYAHAASIYDAPGFACVKGCCACCTQNVTMTSLEGDLILDYLKGNDIPLAAIENSAPNSSGNEAGYTTNQFALACLNHQDLTETDSNWNFEPCIFLDNGICMVYPVRPFGCRCFVSESRCSPRDAAEISPELLTISTIVMQIIEHIDQGNPWGNMIDVLQGNINGTGSKTAINAQPLPGFLINEAERPIVMPVIQKLLQTPIRGKTLGQIIHVNFYE